jgi:hypothetical protein
MMTFTTRMTWSVARVVTKELMLIGLVLMWLMAAAVVLGLVTGGWILGLALGAIVVGVLGGESMARRRSRRQDASSRTPPQGFTGKTLKVLILDADLGNAVEQLARSRGISERVLIADILRDGILLESMMSGEATTGGR